jgi:hypothetical protein
MKFNSSILILLLGFFCFLVNADTGNKSNDGIQNGLKLKSNKGLPLKAKKYIMPPRPPTQLDMHSKNLNSMEQLKTDQLMHKKSLASKGDNKSGKDVSGKIVPSITNSGTMVQLRNTHIFTSILFSIIFLTNFNLQ